jgi:hypothetical protein
MNTQDLTPKKRAAFFIARHTFNGATADIREACGYVTYPGGLTYYYDWSMGDLFCDCWNDGE